MTGRRVRFTMFAAATVGVVALLSGVGLYIGLSGFEETERALTHERTARLLLEQKKHGVAKDAIAQALSLGTVDAWERATTEVNALGDEEAKRLLQGAVVLKRLEAYTRARDDLLARAVEVAQYDENDPRVAQFIDRAKPLQDEIMKTLTRPHDLESALAVGVSDKENRALQGALWYHVGHANYSQLWFTPSENKTEINKLIQKALASFTTAFAYLPKDTRTEYAIEALYEVNKKKNDQGGQEKGKPKRPLLLPQKERAPTSGPGQMEQGI